jgi:hypothetical protein
MSTIFNTYRVAIAMDCSSSMAFIDPETKSSHFDLALKAAENIITGLTQEMIFNLDEQTYLFCPKIFLTVFSVSGVHDPQVLISSVINPANQAEIQQVLHELGTKWHHLENTLSSMKKNIPPSSKFFIEDISNILKNGIHHLWNDAA